MGFDMMIGDAMTKGVHTLDESKTAFDAANLLMEKKIGSVIITRKDDAIGIITERDIVYKIVVGQKDSKQINLSAIMSHPLKAIGAEQTVQDAALAMRENNVKRLPVLDKKGKLVGIITEGDLITIYPGIVDLISETPRMQQ